jgi:hypothetical protein
MGFTDLGKSLLRNNRRMTRHLKDGFLGPQNKYGNSKKQFNTEKYEHSKNKPVRNSTVKKELYWIIAIILFSISFVCLLIFLFRN